MNLVNQSAGLLPQSRPRTLHTDVEKQSKHQNPAHVCTSWRRSRIIHKSTPWYLESAHSALLQPFLPGQTYKAQLPVLHANKLNSLFNNKMTDQSTPNRYVPSSLQLERESILRRDTRTSLRKPSLAVAYSKPCDPPSGIHAANCECLSFDCKGSLTLCPSPRLLSLSPPWTRDRSPRSSLDRQAYKTLGKRLFALPPLILCALVSNNQMKYTLCLKTTT